MALRLGNRTKRPVTRNVLPETQKARPMDAPFKIKSSAA
jgi:hypothetical protein